MGELRIKPKEGYVNKEGLPSGPMIFTSPPPADTMEQAPKPSTSEVFGAAFANYNPVAAAINKYSSMKGGDETPIPGWDVFGEDEIQHIENYPAMIFRNVRSPQQRDRIKREYDQSVEHDKILENAGLLGIAATVAAGATNPLYVIPALGLASTTASTGAAIAMSVAGTVIGEVTTEAAMHAGLDFTRTAEESAINIAGAAVVSSIIGGIAHKSAVASARSAVVNKISGVANAQRPKPRWVYTTKGGWKLKQPTPDELIKDLDAPERLRGVSKILAQLTPARLLASPSPIVRGIATAIGEQNIVGTSRAAIETVLRSYDGAIAGVFTTSRKAWKDLAKTNGPKMSYVEFQREVTKAMRRGDVHQIKAVQDTARAIRKDIIDPITKAAQDAGLLPKNFRTKFAQSYFHRMYDFTKLSSTRDQFIDTVERHLRSTTPGLSQADARTEAKAVLSNILGSNPNTVGKLQFKGTTGPLKNRVLSLSDAQLEPWLVNEFEYVIPHFVRQMLSQTNLATRFGSVDMSEALTAAMREWDDLITAAPTPRARAKLARQQKKELLALEAIRDRLMGRYGLPDDPNSFFVRAGQSARNLNVLSKLGGMTISSIPDLARPLFSHGLLNYSKGLMGLATSAHLRKLNSSEMSRMGAAVELVLNHRLRSISEMELLTPGGASAPEKMLEALAMGGHYGQGLPDFSRITLMSHWNNSMKSMAGLLSSDGLLRSAADPVKFARKLSRGGIPEDVARRIHAEFVKHGESYRGMRIGNSHKWTDVEARHAYESAVLKETDTTIMTPGILDRPLWMSSEMGKLIGQFKSFGFASTNRSLIANLNNFDGYVMQGIIAQVALGGVAVAAKMALSGKTPEDLEAEEFIWRAVEHSGVMGMVSDIANAVHTSSTAVGLVEGKSSRFAEHDLSTGLMGVSGDMASDLVSLGRVAIGDPDTRDVQNVRSLMPYNNLWWLRGLFDRAESSAAAALGAD